MNVKVVSLFVMFCILPCLTMAESDYDTTVEILWGVYPVKDTTRGTTGTRLVLDGVEPSVESFTNRYSARLLFIGDGSFSSETGYLTAAWWGGEASVWDAVDMYGASSPIVRGRLVLDGSLQMPITTFGNPDNDPDGLAAAGLDPDHFDPLDPDQVNAYFETKWSDKHLVVVLLDRRTGQAYHLSSVEGGDPGVAFRRLEGDYCGYHDDLAFAPKANLQRVYAESESGIVYLGAPLPARCVWMADLGLTAADLEGVSERRIALATALGKTPGEVADVKLELGGIDLANGTISYAFDIMAPDGTTNAVTELRYGAELRLLSGTELGRWTETNIVDVAAGQTVRVPTDGYAQFYRMEVVLGP